MLITPSIRNNFFTNAHPEGIKMQIQKQINEVEKLGKFDGPKNVLIIGGSSGYGLASRISLAFGSFSNTVNVSFESQPRGKRTGSAGYWNNAFFQHFAQKLDTVHKDFLGDAFSSEMKQKVIDYIKEDIGKIDLLVYSLAAGARKNEKTEETIRSFIKPIGSSTNGYTLDIASKMFVPITIEPATEEEIRDTVYVMGGEDWQNWFNALRQEGLLAEGFKTISFTYIGTKTTSKIYRDGTMGKAKEHLEKTAFDMNNELSSINGEALISSSKAVVSKASVFIPQMPIYVSCLNEVMTKRGVHESITKHKYRLFKDMVYGESRVIDDAGRLRLDKQEMEDIIQEETEVLMKEYSSEKLFTLNGAKMFLKEFYQINGFDVGGVDYDKDVDISAFVSAYPIK